MFGGSPKFESKKPVAALQKVAKTTVLEFGEQNTQNSIHSETGFPLFAISLLYRVVEDFSKLDKVHLVLHNYVPFISAQVNETYISEGR